MGRRSQRYRTSSLPYAYRDKGLGFELDSYAVDEGERKSLHLKPGQTTVHIPPDDCDDWESLVIHGSIRVPESTVEAVFPEPERSDPPAKLYITIRCHQTIYRDKVLVSESPTQVGEQTLKIELSRSNFREEVELRPYLVRTESSDKEGPYAKDANVRVASGQIYTAIIEAKADESVSYIDGEEASFSRSANLPDGDKLYYLDFRNEARPKLWINADYPRVTDVIQASGSVGTEPRMRDVILDQISYSVWTQLIVRTGTAVDEEGEVEYQWQQTVLEAFAREIYDTDSTTEAALSLRRDVRDPERLPELMNRTDEEIQEFIDPRAQLINLMEEGLKI